MSKSHVAMLVLPAAILAACVESRDPVADDSANPQKVVREALRVQVDRARGTRWELDWGNAYAYDIATGQLIRRVSLTGANLSGAHEACRPDMLLNRFGTVIISSNAQPSLWRISPSRFEIERFDIEVDSDQDKDFGFSGLAWSPGERELFAVSAATGTLWRIDLATAKASKVELSAPIPGACGLASIAGGGMRFRSPTLMVTLDPTRETQLVSLSGDLASGKVGSPGDTHLAAWN